MAKRVGQHCSVTLELLRQFSRRHPDKTILVHNCPKYAEVVEKGVGAFYHDPAKAQKDKIYLNWI